MNSITQRSVEPLPHVNQLFDKTRGARFFTKLDLAMAYMQFCIREEDLFKTSFRVPGGQYKFRVGAFGLHGMSSVLMRSCGTASSVVWRSPSTRPAGRAAPRGRIPVP
jgi:hypothetical protein